MRRFIVPFFGLLACVGWASFGLNELRWRSPTYCIERPGYLWNGAAGPLPTGHTPQCPTFTSAR